MKKEPMVPASRLTLLCLEMFPNTLDPPELDSEECRRIGKHLWSAGMMAMTDADSIQMVRIAWEFMGRGFVYAAPMALPIWLGMCMVHTDDYNNNNITIEDLNNRLEEQTKFVDEPFRLIKSWIEIASGMEEDEAILFQIEQENKAAGLTRDPKLEASLADLENM